MDQIIAQTKFFILIRDVNNSPRGLNLFPNELPHAELTSFVPRVAKLVEEKF